MMFLSNVLVGIGQGSRAGSDRLYSEAVPEQRPVGTRTAEKSNPKPIPVGLGNTPHPIRRTPSK